MPRRPCDSCPAYRQPRDLRDDAAHACAGGCDRQAAALAPAEPPAARTTLTEAEREVLRELGRQDRLRRVA